MDSIFSWVKSIVLFFLLAAFFEEILPSSDYRKYIRTAAGMIFILIVFSPVFQFFQASGSMDYYFQWESLKAALVKQTGEFHPQEAVGQRNEQIMNQYKESIMSQISVMAQENGLTVLTGEICVDENAESAQFGKIKEVTVYVSENRDNSSAMIEPVVIGEKRAPADSKAVEEFRQEIAENYDISADNVHIVNS